MVGKAKIFSDESRESVYQKQFDNEVYSTAQQNSYNLGSTQFSDNSGIGNFSQSGNQRNLVSLKGSTIQGNFGFIQQTVLLDVPTSTINLNNDSAGVVLGVISTDRFVTLSTGTSGTLTTITGAQRPGQRLRLYNTTTNTITVTHTAAATINTIRTPTAANLSFPGNAILDLTYDITSAQWRVVGNIGGGGGGSQTPWVSDIDADGFDLKDLSNIEFRDTTGAPAGTIPSIYNTSIALTLNTPTGKHFHVAFNGISHYIIQETSFDLTGSSILEVGFISSSDIGAATSGFIRMVNNESVSWKNVGTGNNSITNNSSDDFDFIFNGTSKYTFGDTSVKFGASNIDMGDTTNPLDQFFVKSVRLQTGLITVNNPTITSTTGNTLDLNFPTGSSLNIYEQGTVKHTFTSSSLTTPNIILSGALVFNDSLTDPTTNGQFTRNVNDVKVFSGGAVRNLSDIGGGGGANVNLSNITATAIPTNLIFSSTGNDIGNTLFPVDNFFVEQVRFISGNIVTNRPMITSVGGNSLNLNVPSLASIQMSSGGVSTYTFSPTSLTAPNIIVIGDISPQSTGTSMLGSSLVTFNSLFLSNKLQFGNTNRQIASTGNDLLIRTSSGNDIIFREDLTTFFTCNGGSNDIIFSRPINLGANLVSNTANITPTLDSTYDIGTTSLRYENLFVENLKLNVNVGIGFTASGVSIFATDTNDDIFLTAAGTVRVQFDSSRKLGFFGSSANFRQTITGSRGGNTALGNLLTALSSYGLIVNNTTA